MILLFEGLRGLELQVQSKSICLNYKNKRNSNSEISRLGVGEYRKLAHHTHS